MSSTLIRVSFTLTPTQIPRVASNTPGTNTNPITGVSFVGNTPSTVLFFLAMAVGVAIALLFIFFTARYFIRAKFGLHLYSTSNRGMMFLPRTNGIYNPVAFTDREIQEHLEYLRNHHFLRDDFLERRLYASSNRRRRRRRRRGRFAKMKKLSPEEVEKLFPKRRYAEWLNTGDDATSVSNSLIISASAKVVKSTDACDPALEVVEMNEPTTLEQLHGDNLDMCLSSLLRAKPELHFDSGSCAICLEMYELDDVVRGLICGHVYHAECVDPWLTLRRACCPICKRDYYKEEATAGAPDNASNVEEETLNAPEESVRQDAENASNVGERRGASENVPASGGEQSDANIAVHENGLDIDNGEALGSQNSTTANNERVVTPVLVPTENTAAVENEEEESRDPLRDLNFDVIRADANIQALFNELIPLSERVRVLLEEYPHLDLETRARQLAKEKYGNIFKLIFWRLMGISKRDLYNWAVIKTFQEEQASLGARAENAGDSENLGNAGNQRGAVSNDDDAGVTAETAGNDITRTAAGDSMEMMEIRRVDIIPVSNASAATSIYHSTEVDLADAARRETVEERV